ncbi:MAG: thioredoxin domain-containing protein [Spirochaetales bacterium]|nr:thioredoxin domain-containing protein [Spirochaetales bacterium]
MINDDTYTNHLIDESSPYLLQHAHNPVNWYAWGETAFNKAKQVNKPIFLSIGYSTCHWCHVMEKEVFEDKEAAALLNDIFISIKVDREERPDIDKLYMTVSQMLTRSGGWPLTIIMTPDKKPFYAATYIPKQSSYGRPGIMDLAKTIRDLWKKDKEKITEITDQIMSELEKTAISQDKTKVSHLIFDEAYEHLRAAYDSANGGFGTAPKFPQPHNLLFLLKYWKRTHTTEALTIVEKTLTSIRNGGIYDHVGGGFHRYSTDAEWLVPHFEKMLYDQALLVLAYTEAYQATGNEIFKQTAREIINYISRDMTDTRGGFYTAEDADSEKQEGKFYLWTYHELEQVLTGEELSILKNYFAITREGNYRDEATQRATHQNILYRTKADEDDSSSPDSDIAKIKATLFRIREKRVHPDKDDKILTDWNGLMLAAVSVAARVYHDDTYLEMAEKNAHFIMKILTTESGSLLHRYRKGEPGIPGFLDDYAFFSWGLVELYQTSFKTEYLRAAITFTDRMIKLFHDDNNGGFYINPEEGEKLLIQQKEYFDNAIPAGNSIVLLVLHKLARITGNSDYENHARRLIESTSSTMNTYPFYFTQLLYAFDSLSGRSFEIVMTGTQDEMSPFLKALNESYHPNTIVVLKNPANPEENIDNLTTYTKNYNRRDEKPAIYVCKNFTCSLPVHNIKDMMELLE